MGFPIRWNPVEIRVRPLQQAAMDPDYAERSGDDQFGDEVVLSGQPNFWKGQWERLGRGFSGDQDLVRGHILFKIEDLDAGGFTPSVGDAVVSVNGFVQTDKHVFRVIEMRPISPLRGRYLFKKCFIEQDIKLRGLLP